MFQHHYENPHESNKRIRRLGYEFSKLDFDVSSLIKDQIKYMRINRRANKEFSDNYNVRIHYFYSQPEPELYEDEMVGKLGEDNGKRIVTPECIKTPLKFNILIARLEWSRIHSYSFINQFNQIRKLTINNAITRVLGEDCKMVKLLTNDTLAITDYNESEKQNIELYTKHLRNLKIELFRYHNQYIIHPEEEEDMRYFISPSRHTRYMFPIFPVNDEQIVINKDDLKDVFVKWRKG